MLGKDGGHRMSFGGEDKGTQDELRWVGMGDTGGGLGVRIEGHRMSHVEWGWRDSCESS